MECLLRVITYCASNLGPFRQSLFIDIARSDRVMGRITQRPARTVGFDRLARVRNPAYTGPNRCLPCTVVNVGLTAVAALGVATVSLPLGVAVAVAGLTTTYLWGYVVPRTPELTKRYLPDRILAWFDKAPTTDPLGGIDPEAYLRSAGAVVDIDGDIAVPPSVFEEIATRVDGFANDNVLAATLADTVGLNPDEVTVYPDGVDYAARVGRQPAGRWESRVALATELAAHDLFSRRVGGWRALPADTHGALLGAFRLALPRCPACNGDVMLGTETAESCCRAYEVLAATCEGCGSRLFEVDAAMVGQEAAVVDETA